MSSILTHRIVVIGIDKATKPLIKYCDPILFAFRLFTVNFFPINLDFCLKIYIGVKRPIFYIFDHAILSYYILLLPTFVYRPSVSLIFRSNARNVEIRLTKAEMCWAVAQNFCLNKLNSLSKVKNSCDVYHNRNNCNWRKYFKMW